jgi:nucleoside 2-deoxyribosyltransferase
MKRTEPKKFVFVLMPFEQSLCDTYTFGIKQACEELNTYCERVDEQTFTERILDRIYNQIEKADILIAVVTGRNANVFYEVGYAHGLGRSVILCTQSADDITFDFKHFPHIIYNNDIKKLKEQIKTKVNWFLSNDTKDEIIDYDFGLEFLIEGQKIIEGSEIDLTKPGMEHYESYHNTSIDIFNSSIRIFRHKFKIAIETPASYVGLFSGLEPLKPSLDKMLFISKEISSIYPQAFERVDIRINTPSLGEPLVAQYKFPITIDCILKIFTSFELKSIAFKLDIVAQSNSSLY